MSSFQEDASKHTSNTDLTLIMGVLAKYHA